MRRQSMLIDARRSREYARRDMHAQRACVPAMLFERVEML